jgi:predicted ATP-dependent endonuclease of OLD family
LKLQLELDDYKNEIINIRQNQLDESDLGRYDAVATNLELIGKASFPFIFIDEFDAFYHYAVSKYMVKKLKAINCQFVLTTHNTGIMTNRLFRPDSTFIMNDKKILPVFETTDQELRKAHNLEKLYKGGAFS